MTHADLVLTNARIHPSVANGAHADTVAVRDGVIRAVGASDVVDDLGGPRTRVVDLGGATLLPGFQDAHVHPVAAGLEMALVDLSGADSVDSYRDLIQRYAKDHPDAAWITGGGWSMAAFDRGLPRADQLDGLADGRPIYLPNRDHHSAWVNTAALERAGVTASTADPKGGRIERDADGAPTGALHEGAMYLVARHVPPTSAADLRAALLRAQQYLHSLGITAWQDALVGTGLGMPDFLETYLDVEQDGLLTASVTASLWWDRTRGLDQVDDLIERRARIGRRPTLQGSTVKVMQDGVCETFTASVIEPYLNARLAPEQAHGHSFIDADELKDCFTALQRHGFQIHVHALGDRAVREALDAIETARRAHPDDDLRHHLAHLQLVHPDDLPRFRALGVTANAQPLWACHDQQMVDLTLPHLGLGVAERQYPWRSLLDAGARLAFGSDWPVSTPDPLQQLYVAVTRTVPFDRRGGWARSDEPFLPGQCISVVEAVRAFTSGSAYVNNRDTVSGVIEVGRRADLVALSHDPFTGPAEDLLTTTIEMTVAGGRVVHEEI